jgi:CubicO group peptidase (beta-lactamase class C family)
LANLELQVPATADTVFEIGSITKQFTATAIMMLAEQGKLSLDDKISKHVSGTPQVVAGCHGAASALPYVGHQSLYIG